jgi:hypothetical protein
MALSCIWSDSRERTLVRLRPAISHEAEASEADQHHPPGRGFWCRRRCPVHRDIIQADVLVALLTLNGNQGRSGGGREVQNEGPSLTAFALRIVIIKNVRCRTGRCSDSDRPIVYAAALIHAEIECQGVVLAHHRRNGLFDTEVRRVVKIPGKIQKIAAERRGGSVPVAVGEPCRQPALAVPIGPALYPEPTERDGAAQVSSLRWRRVRRPDDQAIGAGHRLHQRGILVRNKGRDENSLALRLSTLDPYPRFQIEAGLVKTPC